MLQTDDSELLLLDRDWKLVRCEVRRQKLQVCALEVVQRHEVARFLQNGIRRQQNNEKQSTFN